MMKIIAKVAKHAKNAKFESRLTEKEGAATAQKGNGDCLLHTLRRRFHNHSLEEKD